MPLQCVDIDAHFAKAAPWVDRANTCDGFKYGDPEQEITGIAVCWQSLMESIDAACAKGCNLLITHEPGPTVIAERPPVNTETPEPASRIRPTPASSPSPSSTPRNSSLPMLIAAVSAASIQRAFTRLSWRNLPMSWASEERPLPG